MKILYGVAAFQRSTDNVIEEDELEDTLAYVDNIAVCGMNKNMTLQEEEKSMALKKSMALM